MNEAQAIQRVTEIENTVKGFTALTEARVKTLEDSIVSLTDDIITTIEYTLGKAEGRLARGLSAIYLQGQFHVNRAYFHASPGLIAIIGGIISAVKLVVNIVKMLANTRIAKIIVAVHKISQALFPKYKAAVDKVLGYISNAAKQLGYGVDGFQHLIHAVATGTGILGGFFGWDGLDVSSELYVSYEKTSKYIAEHLKQLQDDPATWLQFAFYGGEDGKFSQTSEWWDKTYTWINTGIEQATAAVEGLAIVTEDLQKFGESLPSFIRQYIPQSIWDGLDEASNYIHHNILPQLSHVGRQLDGINDLLGTHSEKLTGLADDLKHPGTVLLGVDDLPDYARDSELWKIDDVTSRQFESEAEAERVAMSDTIEQMELITEAMSAPTPEPSFLSIEAPGRRAATGIVEEPRETWFVGDF